MTDIIKNRRKEPAGRIRQKNQGVILAAAEEEFLTYGFKGASMKRVAERADLPRANIHYYYKNKLDLYAAVLGDIVEIWNTTFDTIRAEDDPKQALTAYIRAKVMYSKTNPAASRIFASEIIHGAPHLSEYLKTDFREWIGRKVEAIQSWIDQGKMDPIDPIHLLFFIWGSTQHYADFGVQVLAAMNKEQLDDEDFERIADNLVRMVLKGCGIS
ncbi:TetR family transcriptional regulator [Pseudomaricurvus alkylphenolicus]|uniref:TetR/AcrR family transcriptional regulator n=1 Tax=Pseudomaricurvus alkylphenolicus TaxID=1306991 RepID=UPI001420F2B7|nr:TetR/AcrR family transcriptional regulator [Pseudomaricurvus alkylphenolicus]NIB40935.1 TetR family transcriptional regulator [Pseudomaricurvus alkylphenolicus]